MRRSRAISASRIAYMYAETGDVNTIVHQWAYEDAADRAKRRAAMLADPEWQIYLGKLNEFGLSGGAEDLADDPGEVLADQAVAIAPSSHAGDGTSDAVGQARR